jgi:hypothetical protein
LAPVIITGELLAEPASSPGANVLMLAHVSIPRHPQRGEQGDLTHVNTICISLHHTTHFENAA